MKAINIYSLTRINDPVQLSRLERQLSGRSGHLKIKAWETEGLRAFCERLLKVYEHAASLRFYYSFTMPKLGKEFDLLRISEDFAVNIELKSGNVPDEAIQRQLVQNKYYISALGKGMAFYTYISGTDRLVRLSNSGRLIEADWEELAGVLSRQGKCSGGEIEDLFKEDSYLISPLTDPARFLRQDYFLTSQQRDIKKQILRHMDTQFQGFTGFPGTGKTILLYDIAMHASRNERVCVFHLGPHTPELEQLDQRLKRIDFYYLSEEGRLEVPGKYAVIFVDEGHRINTAILEQIRGYAEKWGAPVILSYDREDAMHEEETGGGGAALIEAIPGILRYRLTNRIRLNSELSAFIRCLMWLGENNHRSAYPSVTPLYASDGTELNMQLKSLQEEGYVYIRDEALGIEYDGGPGESVQIGVSEASCKEYDAVVMILDASFTYDDHGYLRHRTEGAGDQRVRNLFHGLSRAKHRVSLIIYDNPGVFDAVLALVQRQQFPV